MPQIGKSYTEGLLKEPRSINPLFAVQDADRDIAHLIFSGLLAYSNSGELIPDLAEQYEVSGDGKSYTIFLRKNAWWHDGKPVGAEDVIFTVKTIQNPYYKSVLRANWQGVTAEKLDDYTIRFTLKTPYAPFIENLTTGILPKHLWESINPEQALLHELNLKPIGSGPYKFDNFKQEKDGSVSWYRLKRNPKYFREGPYLKKITFVPFSTEEELLTAWKKGLVEGFGPVSSARLSELASGRFSVHAISMPRIFGIFFNEKGSPALADLKVRQAIARSIDRNELIEKILPGGAASVATPLPFLKTTEGEAAAYPYDLEKARELLEQAGWKDTDGDGLREKRTRQKGKEVVDNLRFTLTTSDWPDLLHAAEIIRGKLREIGIDVTIEKRPFSDLETTVLRPRNFEILLFGQVYGYEPDPFAFWHSSQIKDPGLNIALYSNKKADQILEEVRRTSDAAARFKKYEEFSQIVSKDLPALFLYSQLYLYLLPSDIRGADISKISLPSDRFNEINKWYRETKRVLK
ncbi:MAG: peptide ABC transporter substrate-binding protein [Candidatus Sungbacteria bacterium]|nr:peptide ABC transporter substrate-binding protein [Candidatus Sungbacteria bacterium]